MTLRVGIAISIILLGAITHTEMASAASFDCSNARAPRDRLICESPTLSAMDSVRGSLYKTRKARLTSEGQSILTKSQRSWLRHVYTVCSVADNKGIVNESAAIDCLMWKYTKRLSELHDGGVQFWSFVLNRIDEYRVTPAIDETGEEPRFYIEHVGYPQIDNAIGPHAADWNKIHTESIAAIDSEDSMSDNEIG